MGPRESPLQSVLGGLLVQPRPPRDLSLLGRAARCRGPPRPLCGPGVARVGQGCSPASEEDRPREGALTSQGSSSNPLGREFWGPGFAECAVMDSRRRQREQAAGGHVPLTLQVIGP